MDFKYGQYIKYKTEFGHIYSIFLCYRPDKDTIVYDYDGRLHEIDFSEVEYVSSEEMLNYFDKNINKYKEELKKSEDTIKEIGPKLEKINRKHERRMKRYYAILQKLNDKKDAVDVIRELSENRYKPDIMNDLNIIKGKITRWGLRRPVNIQAIKFTNRKKYEETRILEYKQAINEWENKKKKYLKEGFVK